MIQKEEKVSEQDITVIIQDQNGKPDTGHVSFGVVKKYRT
jgi:hypothetical protein